MAPGCISDKVYFFELNIKFYIKSSPKTLKLVNFSHGIEKGAKISYGSYPKEFVPEVKNTKIIFQKSSGQNSHWDSHEFTADGRVTDFFFVKTCFSPIKSSNSYIKSIKKFFWKNQYFILTSFIGVITS
jgi:hypothetical protein